MANREVVDRPISNSEALTRGDRSRPSIETIAVLSFHFGAGERYHSVVQKVSARDRVDWSWPQPCATIAINSRKTKPPGEVSPGGASQLVGMMGLRPLLEAPCTQLTSNQSLGDCRDFCVPERSGLSGAEFSQFPVVAALYKNVVR